MPVCMNSSFQNKPSMNQYPHNFQTSLMTETLSIIHTESSKGWGGQEIRTLKEACCLSEHGHQITFIVKKDAQLAKRARDAGFCCHELPMKNALDFSSMWQIKKLIDQIGPDIVNTHSGHDSILAGLAIKLSKTKPAHLRTRHLILPITSKMTYTTLPDHVMTVGMATKQMLMKQGIAESHLTSIVTGFDEQLFDPAKYSKNALRQQLDIDEDTPLIGCVAILRQKKGHDYLIDAVPAVLKNYPNAQFMIVGDGPQKERLTQKIIDNNLQASVHMLGFMPAQEVLPSLDIMVLPTLEEAFGGALIEAQAMEVPVISTTVGGVPEAVENNVTGILVPPENSQALADAMIQLLDNPEKRKTMGKAGRKRALEHFTIEKMGDKLVTLYLKLLESKK